MSPTESNQAGTLRWSWLTGLVTAAVVTTSLWLAGCNRPANDTSEPLAPSSSAAPQPPSIQAEGVDPAVLQAITTAREAVLNRSNSADGWGTLGMTFLAHDFNAEAAVCFEQAWQLAPSVARWPYLQARSIQNADPQRAVMLLEETVALCGNRPAAPRLQLVELLLELHELDRAEHHLRAYRVEEPSDLRAQLAQARWHFLRNEFEACQQQLEAMADAIKAAQQQLLRQAQAHQQRAERDQAQRLLRQAQLLGQQRPAALLLAETMRRLGKPELAEKQRQIAMQQKSPSWPDPYYAPVRQHRTGLKHDLVRADLLFANKRYEESIALLRETIKQYPESQWARIQLGRSLIRTARMAEAEQNAAVASHRWEDAKQVLREALEIDPTAVEAQFRLGFLHASTGDDEEACRWYEKAIENKPDFTMAYFNLANSRNRLGDSKQAIEALRGAIRSQPDFANAHALLGDLLARSGQTDEAQQHLEMAQQLDPKIRWVQQRLQEVISAEEDLEP